MKICAKINIKRGLQSMHAYNLVEKQEPEDRVRVSGKWSGVLVFSCKMTPGWMESIFPYAVNVAINPI